MALNRPNKIIVHHTGGTDQNPLADSSNATAQDIDSWHKTRWPGFASKIFRNNKGEPYHVGYHYVIEKSGKTVQCRGVLEEGAHTIGQNTSSIGICLSGNFDLSMPTKAQTNSFVKLYSQIVGTNPEFPITKDTIFPHRKYANKTCYGNNLTDDFFNNLLTVQPEPDIKRDLQLQVVQLLTQLYSLLSKKRYSSREIK